MKATLVKKQANWYNLYQNDIGIGSTHAELQGHKLSIKNCQAIERAYDLDELAEQEFPYDFDCPLFETLGITEKSHKSILIGMLQGTLQKGFQKAIELMGDKKFSEDDMKAAYGKGFSKQGIKSFNLLIQSLQQTEWEVEIEMENYEPLYGMGSTPRPKLDADGCLILKRI